MPIEQSRMNPVNRIAVLAGALAAVWVSGPAGADPVIAVTVNSTDPWLVANGLVSATISVTGFEDGQAVQGFHGFPVHLWQVSTTAPDGFFNIPSAPPFFDGEQPFASSALLQLVHPPVGPGAAFDSGLLPALIDGISPFGTPYDDHPTEDVGNFARHSDGTNENFSHVGWITLSLQGVPVDSTTTLPVMRVTWPNDHSVTIAFMVEMNTPMVMHHLDVEIPAPERACPEDVTGDRQVGVSDVLAVISAWGAPSGPADVNGDGTVNVSDLLAVIGAWGACQ